jgi:thioredoxin 1
VRHSLKTLSLACALGAALVVAPRAFAVTQAPFTQSDFDKAQAEGKPILIDVTAPWCPVCAKQHPILSQLYETPEFKDLRVFTVDFDSSKPLLRKLGVQMQSTMIVYHGTKEEGRATGMTSAPGIHDLLAKANA